MADRVVTWYFEGQVKAGTSQGLSFRADADYAPERVTIHAGRAPTGVIKIDINADGESIFGDIQPELLSDTIEDDFVFEGSVASIGEGSIVTLDFDAVGSGEPGEDVTIQLDLNEEE